MTTGALRKKFGAWAILSASFWNSVGSLGSFSRSTSRVKAPPRSWNGGADASLEGLAWVADVMRLACSLVRWDVPLGRARIAAGQRP